MTDPTRYANDQETILDAVDDAETQLEWDINSGDTIPETDRERIHAHAVKNYATYVLKLPSAAPGSRRAGDSADDGESRRAVAKEYKSIYKDKIGTILDNTGDADEGTGDDIDLAWGVEYRR